MPGILDEDGVSALLLSLTLRQSFSARIAILSSFNSLAHSSRFLYVIDLDDDAFAIAVTDRVVTACPTLKYLAELRHFGGWFAIERDNDGRARWETVGYF